MTRRKRERKSLVRAPATDGDGLREPGRFAARRKTETILRMLRGEPLDSLARELGVTAATLAAWREQFMAGGQAALKTRPAAARIFSTSSASVHGVFGPRFCEGAAGTVGRACRRYTVDRASSHIRHTRARP